MAEVVQKTWVDRLELWGDGGGHLLIFPDVIFAPVFCLWGFLAALPGVGGAGLSMVH